MQEKVERLTVPPHISRRTVLIHVNGVSDELADERYFSIVVDFGQLLVK